MVASTKVLSTLAVVITASWAILLVSIYLIFEVVVPISAPRGSPYEVELWYAIFRAALAVAIMGAWLYSFYVLRDAYVRLTGLRETPSSASSHRTSA